MEKRIARLVLIAALVAPTFHRGSARATAGLQEAEWKAGGPGVQVLGSQRLSVRRDGYSLSMTIEKALEDCK